MIARRGSQTIGALDGAIRKPGNEISTLVDGMGSLQLETTTQRANRTVLSVLLMEAAPLALTLPAPCRPCHAEPTFSS